MNAAGSERIAAQAGSQVCAAACARARTHTHEHAHNFPRILAQPRVHNDTHAPYTATCAHRHTHTYIHERNLCTKQCPRHEAAAEGTLVQKWLMAESPQTAPYRTKRDILKTPTDTANKHRAFTCKWAIHAEPIEQHNTSTAAALIKTRQKRHNRVCFSVCVCVCFCEGTLVQRQSKQKPPCFKGFYFHHVANTIVRT